MNARLRSGLVIGAAMLGLLGGLAATASAAKTCKTVTESRRVTREVWVWRVVHGRRVHERVRQTSTIKERVKVCEVASVELSASSVAATGGSVTIHYAATGASSCKLSASPAFWSGANTRAVACRGTYAAKVTASNSKRQWAFHFVAKNRHGQTLTVSATMTQKAPALIPVTQYESSNWSGYAVTGSAFTAAAGTFNVPTLAASASESDTSEWVGIDGVSDTSLIQAGVHEEYDPSVGSVEIWAWWEVLPNPEVQISSMVVSPGDRITVQVAKISGSTWGLEVADNTTGQSYTTDQPYSGPGTSAEWIVEAPSLDGAQLPLGDYSPDVTFSGVAVNGTQVALDQVFMLQDGLLVSSPSAFDANGFTVAYGPAAPAAP